MSVLTAVLASGCATYGFPGFEAAGVVAGNQALVSSLGLQAQQAVSGYTIAGMGNVPICRLQDLGGLPPVNQPVLVRVGKSRGHRAADIVAGAAIVGGTVYIATGGDAGLAGAGAAAGAGGGMFLSNHEYDLCVFVPVPVAPSISPAPAPVQPPAPSPQPEPPPPPREQPGLNRVRV